MVLWHKCSPVNSYGRRGNPSSAIPSLRPHPRTFKPDLLPIHHHDSPHHPFPDIHLFFATISGLHLHDNSFCTGQMLFCIILKVSRDSGCADRWISCTNNNATFSHPLLSHRNIFSCLIAVILVTPSISSSTCIISSHRHVKIIIEPRTDTFTTIHRTETLARIGCPSWKPYRMFTNSNVAFTLGSSAVLPSLFVTRWLVASTPPPRRLRRHFRLRNVGSAYMGCWAYDVGMGIG
jgi:hypothetical protein